MKEWTQWEHSHRPQIAVALGLILGAAVAPRITPFLTGALQAGGSPRALLALAAGVSTAGLMGFFAWLGFLTTAILRRAAQRGRNARTDRTGACARCWAKSENGDEGIRREDRSVCPDCQRRCAPR